MLRYRIYTENTNYEATVELARKLLKDFTLFHADGFWHGKREKSLVFEVLTDDEHMAEDFAYRVKKLNSQECVLITSEEVSVNTIGVL
jgi:hypothetical protein